MTAQTGALARRDPRAVLRPLDELAAELQREHEAAEAAFGKAVEHALNAGRLLIAAKAQVPYGQWLSWLERNFPASARTAQGYMQLAARATDAQPLAHLGIQGALRELARPAQPPKTGGLLTAFGSTEGAMDELASGEPLPREPRRVSLSKGVGGKTWRDIRKAHERAERACTAGRLKLEVVRDVQMPDELAAEELRLAVDYYREEISHRQAALEEMVLLANYMDQPRR